MPYVNLEVTREAAPQGAGPRPAQTARLIAGLPAPACRVLP
ncbi:hypothetical protein [Hoeflea sp. BAL378]|nr:hypothetical protein [Hoeflea sp. BAL378]